MDWAPPWLGVAYCKLYSAANGTPFLLDQALGYLQVSREQGRVILSELARRAYLMRLSRGRYMARSPLEVVFGISLGQEHPMLKQRTYEPLLREVLTRLFERFRENLISVVLYGSVARGTAKPTSDLDLLAVVRGLPLGFYERAEAIGEALRGVHDSKIRLWRESGRYVNVDILPFTPEEAEVLRLLYLDFLFDGIILYDREGFMRRVLDRLGRRVRELGGRRTTMPSGKWYWSFTEAKRKGLDIEL